MTITKVIKDLIEPSTYNQITSNIGNTQPVTINSIQFANVTFVNTSNTSMLTTGGYFKLYGNNYQNSANVYLDRYIATNTQYISNTELRVTFSTIPAGRYSLFLYNPDGSNAIKYNSLLVQGNNTLGYIVAGTAGTGGPGNFSSVERITFSNDTITADTRANLGATRAAAFSLSTNQYGYILSGRANSSIGSPSGSGTNYRINFNNDTASAAAFGVVFSPGTYYGSSVYNSSYGYLGGGTTATGPAATSDSNIYRFDFSSDSSVQSSRLNLDTARGNLASGQNNNFGWFFGGYLGTLYNSTVSGPPSTQNAFSLTSRMDFSADTNLTIVRGPIGQSLFAAASVSSDTYAWVYGGAVNHMYQNPFTPLPQYSIGQQGIVYRFDFNNDTTTGTTRVSTGTNRMFPSGVDNNEYGWFMGGAEFSPSNTVSVSPAPATPSPMYFDSLPGATTYSTVSRLTFSNDTLALSTRGSLNQTRRNASGINGINT